MTYTTPKANQRRNAAMGKIHIAKKQLGMDLSPEVIDKVVKHLESIGAAFTKANKAGRAPHSLNSQSNKADLLKKIEALLAEAGRPWAYATSMAKRMYKKDTLEFCSATELTGIIAGPVKNAQREGRRTQ